METAVVLPVLLLIVFGIIEFGWAFEHHLDTRHGAREAARLVSVNYRTGSSTATTQRDQIVTAACQRMDDGDAAEISLSRTGDGPGATATVTVRQEVDTLTGFLDFILGDKVTVTSSIDSRLERQATWSSGTVECA